MKFYYPIIFSFFFLVNGFALFAQDAYLYKGSESHYLYQRLETLNGIVDTNDIGGYLNIGRKDAVALINAAKINAEIYNAGLYNRTEYFNINRRVGENGEWIDDAVGMDGAQRSYRPVLKYFYTTKENLYHYNEEDFYLSVNPVLYGNLGKDNSGNNLITNFRGAEFRGRILNRIGFYTMLGDNQEKPYENVGKWEEVYKSFPGNDYYIRKEDGTFDAFTGRGYFTYDIIPNVSKISFGYDKQFIGLGVRSLAQSNETAASTFLRIQTTWNGFQLDNLYQELVGDFIGLGNDDRLKKKYYSFHQVSRNIGSKLNIAIFESTIYGYKHFKAKSLIPVPFANTVMRSLASHQKTSLGYHLKYIPLPSFQIYSQALFDEIVFSKSDNSIDNTKFAAQLGLKYYNFFGLKNLDIQLEANWVAPYMYQAKDSTMNYTHYNQPLAHSMGAGFTEGIFKLRYQPAPRWYIDGLASVYKKKGNVNYYNNGNDLRQSYNSWKDDATIVYDNAYIGMYLNGTLTYELFTNFFIEVGGLYLNGKGNIANLNQGIMGFAGIRWNIAPRHYMIYNM